MNHSLLPLAAVALLAAACLPQAACHGMLQEPLARNMLSYQAGLQYDPQSFSAGGEGMAVVQGHLQGLLCWWTASYQGMM